MYKSSIEFVPFCPKTSRIIHVSPMAGSHLEGVFAIKNSGGLLQCSIFGLNEEEPQEHEFKSQPANIDKLNFK